MKEKINKVPIEGSQWFCLLVIMIYSVFRTGKSYYPQAFLKECKYIAKEKKIPIYFTDDLEISDEKNYSKKNSDGE